MSRTAPLPSDLGTEVPGWTPPPAPVGDTLTGRHVVLEKLDPDRHATGLFEAYRGHDEVWDYLPYGPFHAREDYAAWLRQSAASSDPLFYALCNAETGRPEGVASYLRITPAAGSIEVGHINLSPAIQRSPAATEAMYLMMRWAFEAGYRRYEWKCNARNIASRRAAQRLGFSFEGVFRQAAVVKGRNRDTAWFAAIDREWPELKLAFETWLDPANFDKGVQCERLGELTRQVRVASDPVLYAP